MQPSHNRLSMAREAPKPRLPDQTEDAQRISRSLSGVRRLRSDGMFDLNRLLPCIVGSSPLSYPSIIASEAQSPSNMVTIYSFDHYSESWIEVSSQPSSSSLSSAAADEANPNGLRLQFDHHSRRRRRLNRNQPLAPGLPIRSLSAAGSSQEEYEESESESDCIMTSSNEALEQHTSEDISPGAPASSASASEETSSNNAEDDGAEDDDENSTALGVLNNEPVFTPQPNAFSHPPQSSTVRHARSLETRTSYFPVHRTSPHRRPAHSYPSRARTSHTPYNMIAPSHTADHDAALRASLSTLLSCAAAARGLPKGANDSSIQHEPRRASNRVEPSALRLVPESAITREPCPPSPSSRPSVRRRNSATSLSNSDKGKRKASPSKDRTRESRSKKRRANSPGRDMTTPHISPTLMTWVVSAGVVVLFSAISFSAGYAIGRDVGRLESGTMGGKDGIVCGKEVGRGLRRLRWGGSSVSIVRV